MAAPKPSLPSAAIFTSDPLEQIFGQGVLSGRPGEAGLAYMFMNALGTKRKMDQEAYNQSVERANALSYDLSQKEIAQKQLEQLLKSGTELAGKGYQPSSMPIMQTLMPDTASGDTMANLMQAFERAKIAQANAAASNSTADKTQVKVDIGPGGTGIYTVTGKGPNALPTVNQNMIEILKKQGQLPQATPTDAKTMLNLRGGYGNVN